MRHDSERAYLELSAEELAGAVTALDLPLGPLAPGRLGNATPQAQRAFEDALPTLSDTARVLLGDTLATLTDPDRSLKLVASAGDAYLHRAVYAWKDAGCAMLASRAGINVLAVATADDISATIITPVLPGDGGLPVDVHAELDGRAVLALVGAADALRAGRMAALLGHAPVPESVTAAEVAARLADSMIDDPRWTASLFASVLPFDASAFMDASTVDLAMGRLAQSGLFAAVERDGAFPATYHPTDEGLVALHTIAGASGRVALTLFEKRADALAYESILLISSPFALLMASLAPEGGGVAPLSAGGLSALASRITGP